MKILGIGLSHCCGVCYIEDGAIVFAQEEDRFSRIRRHKGWPERSLTYLFQKYNLQDSDIDICVLCDFNAAEYIKNKIHAKKVVVVHHHLAHIMSGWALTPWRDFDAMSLDGGGDYGSWLSFGKVRNRKIIHWESNCGSYLDKNNVIQRKLFNFGSIGKPFGSY